MKINTKELVIMSMVTFILFSSTFVVAKDFSINVAVDDKYIEFSKETGIPYADESQRAQVPLRRTMESLGVKVDWDSTSKSAVLTKGDTIVKVPLGVKYITVNNKNITTDCMANANGGRIYLPIRPVAEAFLYDVSWIAKSYTVSINSQFEDEKVPEAILARFETNAILTGKGVNVRKSPNLYGEVVYKLDESNRVKVINKTGFWYGIEDGDNIYYIHQDYVKVDEGVYVEEITPAFTMPTADKILPSGNKTYHYWVKGTDKWNDLILEVSSRYNVDPIFVKCIMAIESAGNVETVASNKYYGLMQISKDFGYDTERILNDPEYAISCGIEVILGKANSCMLKGYSKSCFNVAWFYNQANEQGKVYANKIATMYQYLSDNTSDTIVIFS